MKSILNDCAENVQACQLLKLTIVVFPFTNWSYFFCRVPMLCDADIVNETNISQRRADAAVFMAETSPQHAGREIATADRYQLIVSLDATDISASTHNHDTPKKRPTVKGAGPIACETARRIACDCSLSTYVTTNGEPTNIVRKSRIWLSGMSRAKKERDQHCQFPGCTRTHHLQIHHLVHWADGGSTSVSNGACLCACHHSLVH